MRLRASRIPSSSRCRTGSAPRARNRHPLRRCRRRIAAPHPWRSSPQCHRSRRSIFRQPARGFSPRPMPRSRAMFCCKSRRCRIRRAAGTTAPAPREHRSRNRPAGRIGKRGIFVQPRRQAKIERRRQCSGGATGSTAACPQVSAAVRWTASGDGWPRCTVPEVIGMGRASPTPGRLESSPGSCEHGGLPRPLTPGNLP